MNIRRSNYADYGITESEKKEILEKCQSGGIDLQTVLECAIRANPALAKEIFVSIVYKLSFEKIDTISTIYALKEDFYGYRRKTIALLREQIKGIQNVNPRIAKCKSSSDIKGQTSIYDWMPEACPKK